MRCILTCCALVCASGLLTPGYSATARRWVAHNSDSGNWSEPGNWQPAGVPQDGDDLLFEITSEDLSPLQYMINDLTGLSIRKLEFCSDGWSLAGNELAIGQYVGPRLEGTNVCASGSFRFDCPLKLAGPTRMDTGYGSTLILKGYIDLNGYDLLLDSRDIFIVSGEIRGTGNVTAALDAFNGHDSKITFDGPVGNTFSGKLIIRQLYDDTGVVIFDKQFGAVVNDALLIGERSPVVTPATRATCKLARSHQIGDSAEVCVAGGSNFLLDGHTETIGSLSLTNVSGDTQPSLVDTGGSTLSVQGDITAVNDSPLVIPTIRGKLGLPGPAPAPAMNNEAQTRALRRRSITK